MPAPERWGRHEDRAGASSMLLTAAERARMADALAAAERDRVAMPPLTATSPGMTLEDAYDVQLLNVARRVRAGGIVRGHKVGLTARSMQEMFGIDEPDYGHLLDDMFVDEASTVAMERYIAPYVEMEPAFVLSRPLEGPGITVADVLRATDCVLPALEIIDSRIADWKIQLADTVADNGSSAGIVLGGKATSPRGLDLRALAATLYVDGEAIRHGSTAAVLGNPATAVAWLANTLAGHEIRLDEGHVVLPGTCSPAVRVRGATSVRAEFEELGDVTVTFE